MYGRLLMAHQNVLDGVLLVESVVNMQDSAAGIAPDVLDPFACSALTRISAPRKLLCVLNRLAAAAEVIRFEISMMNLVNFSNEKPWVPLRKHLWRRVGT